MCGANGREPGIRLAVATILGSTVAASSSRSIFERPGISCSLAFWRSSATVDAVVVGRGEPAELDLSCFHLLAEGIPLRGVSRRAHLREHLLLFLLGVVLDRLDQHLHLRDPLIGSGLQRFDLVDERLGDVVLLESFVDCVADRRREVVHGRVEDLFLDRGVDLELLDDLVRKLGLLGGVVLALGVLEATEQATHAIVVGGEQIERVHECLQGENVSDTVLPENAAGYTCLTTL